MRIAHQVEFTSGASPGIVPPMETTMDDTPSNHPPDPLLTTAGAAQLLSVSEGFLRADRLRRTGRVAYIRVGRAIRYRQSDLVAFLEANTVRQEVVR